MEHIVQFGVCIDDNAIEKAIIERVGEKLETEIKKQCQEAIFETRYGRSTGDFNYNGEAILKAWLDENKELITDKAADRLVESLKRSKYVKQVVNKKLEEEIGDISISIMKEAK